MTEEEKKRWGEELKRRRQAENKAKGAHKTSARPDAPRATTGQEDTNTALEAATQGGASEQAPTNSGTSAEDAGVLPKAADIADAKAEEAGQTENLPDADPAAASTGTSTIDAGAQPNAAGITAEKEEGQEAQTTQPQGVQHGTEMDGQSADGLAEQDGNTAQTVNIANYLPDDIIVPNGFMTPEMESEYYKALVQGITGEYTPASIGEAVAMFKGGRGVYLSEEMMQEAQRVLTENPELQEDIWLLGEDAFDAKEDEYAFLLGKETKKLLMLLESPHLPDDQRGAGIEQYLKDKQAARAEGHYQLDGYYKKHPEALSAYDGLRQIENEGITQDNLIAEAAREERQESSKLIFCEAIDHELDGPLTDENRIALVALDEYNVFEDDDAFFQEVFGKTTNLVTQNGVRNLQLLDEALRPIRREKQMAMALGMDLETFWKKNPDRMKTPEELTQNALDWFDAIYQKPLEYAVAGRTQNGYTAAVLDYLTKRDEERVGLSKITPGATVSMGDLYNAAETLLGGYKPGSSSIWKAIDAGQGKGKALVHAADAALTTTVAGLEKAGVMAFGHSPEENVQLNRQHYEELYGPWGRAMYRHDVLSIIYEFYDEDEKEETLKKLSTVGDIYDMAIDTRPFLAQLDQMAERNDQKVMETYLFIAKYGNEREKAAFERYYPKFTQLEQMLASTFVAMATKNPALAVAAGGVPAMGNKFGNFLQETEDWDSSKTAAFGGFLIRTAIAVLPFPPSFNIRNKGQMEKGLQTVTRDGIPAMRAMWQSLVQFAESPIVQTTSGVVLKAGTATGVSESFEDFVLHGKIDDAIKIVDDCLESGQTAGAAFVAIWLAGFTGLEESTVGKRIFSTGKGLDQQNLAELRGALASIKENPQALAKIELGMRQSFVDDWVGQSIAAGALNTSLVKKASIAAETAQHDLQTVQGTLQQKEFAVGNSINDLDAAMNKMLTSDGMEWEKAKQEVLNCVQSLKAQKTELAEVQELVGPRQQTADNANDALLKEQNIVLSGLRIQGEKMYDAQGGAGNEVQEGNGLTTPAAQETNELAETENPKDTEISDETGDLQETTDANGDIMEEDKGENTFADSDGAEKDKTIDLKDDNAPLTDFWRVDNLNQNYSADFDGTSDVTEWGDRTDELAKMAPIIVPETAVANVKQKQGYDQIAYKWRANGCIYEVRWHTKTPGAPEDQVNTWVVSRTISGTPERQYKIRQILVGGKWVSKEEWEKSKKAYGTKSATPEQLKLLEDGHWRAP